MQHKTIKMFSFYREANKSTMNLYKQKWTEKYAMLTHSGLVAPYGIIELVNIGAGNGLLPDGTKPLPEPILTNHE